MTGKTRHPPALVGGLLVSCFLPSLTNRASAETGYDLWLRYAPVSEGQQRDAYRKSASAIVGSGSSATYRVTVAELQRGLRGLLGAEVPVAKTVRADGAVVVGTPSGSPVIAGLGWTEALAGLGHEGYLIRSARIGGHAATVIASAGEIGALYGAFHFLRLIQTDQPVTDLDIAQRPRLQRQLLNHWDNLDGTIERGYAGPSLWKWEELPARVDPRVLDYARANASIGINGTGSTASTPAPNR